MRGSIWLAAALTVGLHVAMLARMWPEPARFVSVPDSQQYLALAANLRAGHGFSQMTAPPYQPDFLRTPVYPALLALLPGTGDAQVRAAAMLNVGLGLCTIALAVGVVWTRFGVASASLTAWLLATDITSLTFHHLILTESAFAFALLGAIVVLTREPSLGVRYAALGGMGLGVAALCRPIAVLLAPALAPLFAARAASDGRRAAMRSWVACALVAGIVVSAWVVRNAVVFGEARLSSVGGVNLYVHRAAFVEARRTGEPVEVVRARLEAELERSTSGLSEADRNRWLESAGRARLMAHPIDYALEHLEGVVRMAGPERDEIFDAIGVARRGALARVVTVVGGLHLAVLYVCVGRALVSGGRRLLPWAAVSAFLYTAVVGGPEMSARFRMPLMPLLAAAAGLAIQHDRFSRA